jgi:7,8-dihydropterin-6-yl-methyl-4-(beta-D-ribofuranosyl)aminobenzene 5'-phosphate synthase
LGGLHLQGPTEEVIASTVEYVKSAKVKYFYACHDTDMPSKLRLAAVSNFREAGVSLQVELD